MTLKRPACLLPLQKKERRIMSNETDRAERPSVLLISVDALKPEFVFKQEERGVNLPNISYYFLKNGMACEEGMVSVFPTFTYPCHQSMITGANPAVHGTVNNGIFDPTGEHLGGMALVRK